MKLSRYNHFINKNDKLYVYNSNSGAFAQTDKKFKEICEKVQADKNYTSKGKLFAEMKRSRIIVDNDTDELQEIVDLFVKAKQDDENLIFTIAPTLNCNFNCPYCYENKTKTMLDDTQVWQLIDFIKSELEGKKRLGITWYGGEPLLAFNIIKTMSKELIEFCKTNKIDYSAMMITNGYLLDISVILDLIDCKVTRVQITLDGNKEYHDKKRFLPNGQGLLSKNYTKHQTFG